MSDYHLIGVRGGYWRPGGHGYTSEILEAGVFTKEEALIVVRSAPENRMARVEKKLDCPTQDRQTPYMNPTHIHTITLVPYHPADKRQGSFLPCTFGFCFSREEAIAGLRANCDTETGYYNRAVIERYCGGIYIEADQEEWLRNDDDGNGWVMCDKPVELKQVVHFAMG